eukprot:14174967-Alexandrium_andersonii.AAC.1
MMRTATSAKQAIGPCPYLPASQQRAHIFIFDSLLTRDRHNLLHMAYQVASCGEQQGNSGVHGNTPVMVGHCKRCSER